MRFTCRAGLLLSTVCFVIGCGPPTEPEPQGEFSITNMKSFLQLGESFQFMATGSGSRDVQWSSSNPAVLEIDWKGRAVAHSVGASDILASIRESNLVWRVDVVRRIAALEVDPGDIAIVPGDRVGFAAHAVDARRGQVTEDPNAVMNLAGAMTWTVADPAIARAQVSTPWLITGLQEGRTTVRVSLLAATGASRLIVQLLEFRELAVGGEFNCALATDSLPYCWGKGTQFLATTGVWTPTHIPHRAGSLVPLVALVSGGRHSCGLTAAGVAYCWGSNEFGALGIGNATQPIGPVAVAGGLHFSSLSAGGAHTCGIATDGGTFCWGRVEGARNLCGGGGKGDISHLCERAPIPLGTDAPRFSSLSAGGRHTCGLDAEGHAHCWGHWGSRVEPVPVPVGSALSFIAVTSGDEYSCGLTAGGVAYCWGANNDGQLGNGTLTPSDEPVAVIGGLAFASLSASRSESESPSTKGHVCGVTLAGSVYCWGLNSSGESGTPASASRTEPSAVTTPLSFQWVRAGGSHTCAMSLQHVVYCWGSNFGGQLGTPDGTTVSASPVAVAGQRAPAP